MLNGETKRKIKNARDILVGKIPVPTAQVEQITLALMYKFMSDMDEQAKKLGDKTGFFLGEYEKYSWKNITDTSLSAYEKVVLYSEGLEKMNNNPHVPQLFRDIFKGAYLPFKDPEILKLFLDQINEIEYTHSEDLGDAYEYLLSVMGSQGDAGQFRTPRHIIDFIVEIVDPKKDDRILDPACGTAGFLISAYKYILKQNTSKDSKILGDNLSPMDRRNLTKNFVGYDISPEMRRISLVNMYLHQFSDPQIYEYDSLTSLDYWDENFDCILANPPFMTPRGGIRPHNRFAVQANRSEVLFVDYIMEHLSTTGKAGVIVPEGIIFQSSNAYKNLRKLLVEDNYLWGVVSLPSGVFQPYSGVKTSVLLLDKNIAKKTENILFINVENDGFDLGAQRKENGKSDLPKILESLKKYKERVLSDEEVKEEELFNTNIVGKSRIKESGDYNLSGNRYQSGDRGLYVKGKWKMVELSKLCEIKTGKKDVNQGNPEGKYPFFTCAKENTYIDTYTFDTEAILIAGNGDVGSVKYYNGKFDVYQRTYVLFNFKEVLPRYLYYILSNTLKKEMNKQKLGNTMPYIKLGMLQDFMVPLPPIEEQKKIVEELDRYQRIIDGARMVVNNWRPEIEIDPEWEKVTLKEICDLQNGFAFKSSDYVGKSNTLNFRMSNIRPDATVDIYYNPKYLPDSYYEKYNSFALLDGDLVIAMTDMAGDPKILGVPAIVESKGKKLLMNQRVGKFINIHFDRVLVKYLKFILQSDYVKSYYKSLGTGGVQLNISKEQILSLIIPLPPLETQRVIVSRIEIEEKTVKYDMEMIPVFTNKIKSIIELLYK